MINRSLLPILMLCMGLTINGLEEDGTALAIKKTEKIYSQPITTASNSYLDFVRKSKTFVDTSLLLTTAILWRNITVLLAPRKWGKTTNFQMLETFFQMEMDENGTAMHINTTATHRLFKNAEILHDDGTIERLKNPLLISEHKRLVEFYLGNVPVVYMSFKHVIINDPIMFERSIMTLIRGVVDKFKFLVNFLPKNSEQYKTLQNVQNGSLIYMHYCDALKIIFKTLFKHYERRTIVIFDDYDAPLLNLIQTGNYTGEQINYILLVLDTLVAYVLKDNDHVRVGLLSGSFALAKPQLEHINWNYTSIDCVLKEGYECRYFGLLEKEVQSLLVASGDQQVSERLRKWYDGYTSGPYGNFYNPYSVACFLKNKKFVPYWQDVHEQPIVRKFLQENSDTVLSLISHQITHAFPYRHIGAQDVTQLKDGLSPAHFYFYLYRIGYLTNHTFSDPAEKRYYSNYTIVKIPNNEIAAIMSNWMITHYKRKYRIDDRLLHDAAVALQDFIASDSSDTSKLDRSVQTLYKSCSAFITSNLPPTTEGLKNNSSNAKQAAEYEELFFSLLYCVTLKMQSISFFEYKVFYDNTLEADIVVFDEAKRRATLVDLEYDAVSPQNALARALNCSAVFQHGKIEKVKFVGISISLEEVVRSSTTVKDMNVK